ncbi:MAG: selenide water [Actinobacteria bacterium]|nr:MAG: selenide water [Actinomycetota bacterium]
MIPGESEDLMVGFETSDDAAVYRLGEFAVLLTVDFFTPMVDDPYDFGRITAANALSDVYAMGGRPLTAMNLLAMPCSLPAEITARVLQGGADKVREAGAVIVGGHTIDDKEPKYGLSVMGICDPDKVVRNVGARVGDVLVLTKRLGVGILNTALKKGLETEESLAVVIESMAHLNRAASEAMVEVGVNAGTDITGFGLIGHAREMALGSGLAIEIDLAGVPMWPGVLEYSADGVKPGRTADVLAFLEPHVTWGPAGDDWRGVLADPQTSGGLLMAVSPERADALLAALAARGEEASVVGRAVAGEPGTITVI